MSFIKCRLSFLMNAMFIVTLYLVFLLLGSLLALFQERKRFYF